jgi:hypothetical protein
MLTLTSNTYFRGLKNQVRVVLRSLLFVLAFIAAVLLVNKHKKLPITSLCQLECARACPREPLAQVSRLLYVCPPILPGDTGLKSLTRFDRKETCIHQYGVAGGA